MLLLKNSTFILSNMTPLARTSAVQVLKQISKKSAVPPGQKLY